MTKNQSDSRRTVRGILTAGVRLVGDVLVLGLWVLFLTLLFLSTGWPTWAFYGVLLLGVAVYVSITASWFGSSDS